MLKSSKNTLRLNPGILSSLTHLDNSGLPNLTLNTIQSNKDFSVNGVTVPPLLLGATGVGRESAGSYRKELRKKGN